MIIINHSTLYFIGGTLTMRQNDIIVRSALPIHSVNMHNKKHMFINLNTATVPLEHYVQVT